MPRFLRPGWGKFIQGLDLKNTSATPRLFRTVKWCLKDLQGCGLGSIHSIKLHAGKAVRLFRSKEHIVYGELKD